jgi:PAS domain S-box-containing protein
MTEKRIHKLKGINSIRVRVYLLRIVIAILIGASISAFSYWTASGIMKGRHERSLLTETDLLGRGIEWNIIELSKQVEEIAVADEVSKYHTSYSIPTLTTLFRKYSDKFDKISYINEEGIEEVSLISGNVIEDEKDVNSEQYYQIAKDGPNEPLIDGPYYDSNLQGMAIHFLYQHIDFFDQNIGMISASISVDGLKAYLEDFNSTDDSIQVILDSNGLPILSLTDLELNSSTIDWMKKINKNLRSVQNGQVSYLGQLSFDNSEFLVTVKPLKNVGWYLIIANPAEHLSAPLERLRNIIFIFSLLIILCGELFSRLLGVNITEPIDRLYSIASTIAKSGNLNERVQWSSKDELGYLANAFNTMLDKIDEAQKRLLDESQFVENIISSINDGLIVVSEEGIIEKVNPSICRLLDYQTDELIGEQASILFPGQTSLIDDKEQTVLNERGVVFIKEKQLITRSNGQIPLSISVSELINTVGMRDGLLVIGRDIREKKRNDEEKQAAAERLRKTQEELQQTEKLAVVGQMSGMVAHEVLNPVNSIYVRAELNIKESVEIEKVLDLYQSVISEWKDAYQEGRLQDYLLDKGEDIYLLEKISNALKEKHAEHLESLEFIYKLTKRVIRIIDNLREMSRKERTTERFKLYKLVDEVLSDMADGFRKRGITVETDCKSHTEIEADYIEVYSVISNLLKNSIHAIDINEDARGKYIGIKIWEEAELVCIQVTDSGVGMDQDVIERLFTSGFTNKGRKGTGLGLSYSRKITRQLGGDLYLVDTLKGQGSTFRATFYCKEINNEHQFGQ